MVTTPLLGLLFFPVVALEASVIKRRLRVEVKPALFASFVANAASYALIAAVLGFGISILRLCLR